ncbi:MAG: glycosyl hydrolase family 18 protein, partial [Candidatus Eremiobacterota bacterium]
MALWLLLFLTGCGGAGSPAGAGTGALERPAAAFRADDDLDFAVTSDWGSGFGASVTVHNRGTEPLTGWVLEFDFGPGIDSIWNARVEGRAGEHYRVVPEFWNATIPAGGSASFGFNGSPGNVSDRPRNVVLTGTWLSGGESGPSEEGTGGDSSGAGTAGSGGAEDVTGTGTLVGSLDAAAQVTADWGSGLQAVVRVTNPGPDAVSDWRVGFRFTGSVSLWNGRILSREGDLFIVGPESWNAELPAGGSVEVGFVGSPGGIRPTDLQAWSPGLETGTSSSSPDSSPDGSPPPPDSSGTPDATPGTGSSGTDPSSPSEVRVVAYFPEWGIYERGYAVGDIPVGSLDAVIYAFADVSPQGEVVVIDRWAALEKPFPGDSWDQPLRGNIHQLALLKQRHPDLAVLVAVGGWTLSARFPEVARTPEGRERFARSALDFCRSYGFDGLDVDWEYPGPQDRTNFTLLLAELRRQLEPDGLYLTAALPAGPGQAANLDLPQVAEQLDWINLMTYDYHGGWETVTGHHAPLYASDGLSVDDTVRAYLGGGAPAAKIRLGFPAYG